MNIEKTILTDLHRCYTVAHTVINGRKKMFIATEGEGACYMYDVETLEKTTVWEEPGGTMAMIFIPNTNGEFLAVQNFFPTFQSKEAKIVYGKLNGDKWEIKTLFKMPYLHRFDILEANDKMYFLGAVLCNSKEFKDDWSDPGKIYVSEMNDDFFNENAKFEVIKDGLTKNHGYTKGILNKEEVVLVTSEEGIFKITAPNDKNKKWSVEKILNEPTSDVAIIDIDNDGEEELVTIEEFHGKHFRIRKKYNDEYKVIYNYPKEIDFGHVVWGGKLLGVQTIIGGYRRLERELFGIRCIDEKELKFEHYVIDKEVGPSNVCVIECDDKDIILSANREIGQAAIYTVTK